jgi:hypothetical protein
MNVRKYTEADFDRIRELHEQSRFDYILPSFPSEEFFSRRVVGNDGEVGMAAFLKLTAEAYLICDPKWRNSAWRLEALRQLSNQCNSDARDKGVVEVTAFLPPRVVKSFGRRLSKLGWQKIRNDWQCLYHTVE